MRRLALLLVVLVACEQGRKLPPRSDSKLPPVGTLPEISLPGVHLVPREGLWELGEGRTLRHAEHRLEITDGLHVPAWLVSDGHGGYDLTLVDRARLHVTGQHEGQLTVLDERGVALLRITRQGPQASAASGARQLLGTAQVTGQATTILSPDSVATGTVSGVPDTGMALAVGLPTLPEDARALLAASTVLPP